MALSRKTAGSIALAACAVIVVLLVTRDSSTAPAAGSKVKATTVLPAAKPSDHPTVAAIGDITCEAGAVMSVGTCQQKAVADAIIKAKPDSVWLLGDIQYLNGELSQFRSQFQPAFGALRKRWRPAPGNHEYYTPNASGYYEFFGKSAGPYQRGFYSFDIGKWHVVSLNGNCDVIDCKANSFQAKWLRSDLKRHSNKCTAAYWHQPLFSSGKEHGSDPLVRPLWKILGDRKADLILGGHDHDFEVFARQDESGKRDPKGPVEIVAGTGGKSWYQFAKPQPNSKVRIGNTFGFLSLTLNPKAFDWRYISKDSKVLARGSARCV
jgi:3',5'-cyclic AMP phosphodiesterase CpdA